MSKEARMVADTKEKGKMRQSVYQKAIEEYNNAIEHRFFLEAIAIAESLISDRMESYANYKSEKDYSFQTLGKLCDALRNDPVLKSIVADIDAWRVKRNAALHQMAKIGESSTKDYSSKKKEAEATAKDAYKLFRELDNAIRKDRRNNSKSNNKPQNN